MPVACRDNPENPLRARCKTGRNVAKQRVRIGGIGMKIRDDKRVTRGRDNAKPRKRDLRCFGENEPQRVRKSTQRISRSWVAAHELRVSEGARGPKDRYGERQDGRRFRESSKPPIISMSQENPIS